MGAFAGRTLLYTAGRNQRMDIRWYTVASCPAISVGPIEMLNRFRWIPAAVPICCPSSMPLI